MQPFSNSMLHLLAFCRKLTIKHYSWTVLVLYCCLPEWVQRGKYYILRRERGQCVGMTNSRYYRYPSPNPKQPFSLGKDCEQFRYRDEDRFCGFYIAVFTVIDQITQMHMCISVMKSLSDLGQWQWRLLWRTHESDLHLCKTIPPEEYTWNTLSLADNHLCSLTG